jgi:hypothetical protein
MTGNSPTFGDAEIVAGALISDDPKIMKISQLAPEMIAHIVAARLQGLRPVSVRWTTGEFALMFCVPGTNMPSVQNIIAAFRGARGSQKTFPEGDVQAAGPTGRAQ